MHSRGDKAEGMSISTQNKDNIKEDLGDKFLSRCRCKYSTLPYQTSQPLLRPPNHGLNHTHLDHSKQGKNHTFQKVLS
jgi:hypothetical protein